MIYFFNLKTKKGYNFRDENADVSSVVMPIVDVLVEDGKDAERIKLYNKALGKNFCLVVVFIFKKKQVMLSLNFVLVTFVFVQYIYIAFIISRFFISSHFFTIF